MLAFEISINQKPHTVMGIKANGVLSVIIHKRQSADGLEIALTPGALEEHAPGQRRNLDWPDATLKEGDEITVRIVNVQHCDPPTKIKIEDPEETLLRKKEYFERLLAELKEM
jgi:hypothetical protein